MTSDAVILVTIAPLEVFTGYTLWRRVRGVPNSPFCPSLLGSQFSFYV